MNLYLCDEDKIRPFSEKKIVSEMRIDSSCSVDSNQKGKSDLLGHSNELRTD